MVITRVCYLKDDFVVDTKEEAKAALLILEIKNPNADKIDKMIKCIGCFKC